MTMFGKRAVCLRVFESFSVFIYRYTTLYRDLCIGNGPVPFFLVPRPLFSCTCRVRRSQYCCKARGFSRPRSQ